VIPINRLWGPAQPKIPPRIPRTMPSLAVGGWRCLGMAVGWCSSLGQRLLPLHRPSVVVTWRRNS
jgi:hypothetical protein